MKKIRFYKADLISVLICLTAMIPGAFVYERLPDLIAVNFDLNGQPNNFASKSFAVFGVPFLMAALQLTCCLLTNLFRDSEKQDIINKALRFISPTLLYFVELTMLLFSLGQIKNMGTVLCTSISLFYLIGGNYMPKMRRNLFFGIRTPHTMLDQELWNKTHRFAGALYTVCGILMVPFALMNNYIVFGIIVANMLVLPYIYSEITFRALNQRVHE